MFETKMISGDRDSGVTADSFQLANLFRSNLYASGLVLVF